MNWKSLPATGLIVLSVLATMLLPAGCQSIPSTLTGGTSAAETERKITDDICARAWRPVTYSSQDTAETQIGNRAANAARDGFCSER